MKRLHCLTIMVSKHPIASTRSKAKLKRLANNLTQSHPQLFKAQRYRALKEAVVVCEGAPKEAKGQKAFTVQTEKPSKTNDKKTHNFPSFPLAHLHELYTWLQTKGRKGTKGDLCAKCLRCHSSNICQNRLLDTFTTRDYLELCKKGRCWC